MDDRLPSRGSPARANRFARGAVVLSLLSLVAGCAGPGRVLRGEEAAIAAEAAGDSFPTAAEAGILPSAGLEGGQVTEGRRPIGH